MIAAKAPRRSIEFVGIFPNSGAHEQGMFSQLLAGRFLPNPPFVKSVDVLEEAIVIHNPATRPVSMQHWMLSDEEKKHVFNFPEGFVLGAGDEVVLYCTPANLRDPSMLPDKYLLWTNADGSLRKRHVLGTDIDTLILVNADGIEVSSAHIPDSGIVEPLHTARHRAMNSFIRRTNMAVGYLRIAFLLGCGFLSFDYPLHALQCYGVAFVLDLVSRELLALSGPDVANNTISTLGDRVSTFVLIGSLAVLYAVEGGLRLFAGLLLLDWTSSWFHQNMTMPVSLTKPAEDAIDIIRHKYPLVLMLVGVGCELYYLYHYGKATQLVPESMVDMMNDGVFFWVNVLITGCCVLKQIFLVLQLLSAASLSTTDLLSTQAKSQLFGY